MRRTLLMSLALATLAACAAGGPPAEPVDRWGLTPPEQSAERVGRGVVSTLAAPLYVVFKGVTCVASAVLAAPVSAGMALTTRPDRDIMRAELHRGVGQNCGGSYLLDPS